MLKITVNKVLFFMVTGILINKYIEINTGKSIYPIIEKLAIIMAIIVIIEQIVFYKLRKAHNIKKID